MRRDSMDHTDLWLPGLIRGNLVYLDACVTRAPCFKRLTRHGVIQERGICLRWAGMASRKTRRDRQRTRPLTDWCQIRRTGCPSPRGEGRVFNGKAFLSALL